MPIALMIVNMTIAATNVVMVMIALPISLRFEHLHAAAVEQAFERRFPSTPVIGPEPVEFARGEQSQRERAPDAVDAVHRHGADRIVDPQIFQDIGRKDDEHAGDCAQGEAAQRA